MNDWERPPHNPWVRRAALALVAVVALGVVSRATQSDGTAPPTGPVGELEISRDRIPPPVAPVTEFIWPPPRPGRWRPLPPAPLASRVNYSVVWAGSEMIVWGGFDAVNRPLLDGAAFDPADGTWRPLPFTAARDASNVGVAVGSQVVFVSSSETRRYDPAERRWRAEPVVPLPPRHGVNDRLVAVDETVVAVSEPYEREQPSAMFALAPGATEWTRLPDVPVIMTRAHVVLAADSHIVVIGPPDGGGNAAVAIDLADSPATWRPIEAPSGLPRHDLVALAGVAPDGRIMLWGVRADSSAGTHGYAAVRDANGWRRVSPGPLRPTRTATALWTGDRMLVWNRADNVGALFDPDTDQWTEIPAPPLVGLDLAREAVWTGSGLLVWGALGTGGAMYTPR